MSLINTMLQELDKRHAAQSPNVPAGSAPDKLAQQARVVSARSIGSNLFWRVMAAIMMIVVAWVIWVTWQIMPRSVVTDLAYQALSRRGPAMAEATPAAPAQRARVAAGPASPDPQRRAGAINAARAKPNFDMLRLATEIATPIPVSVPKPAPAARSGKTVAAAQAAKRVAEPAGSAERPLRRKHPIALASPGATRIETRIDKRVDSTPRESAAAEFRRAMSQINQGRIAEGMDGLKAALRADSSYDMARQTLVALLLESRRNDEAAALLQAGLALDPANVDYAMPLARIHVERGNVTGALALLRKFDSAAATNADYQAFVAALEQRQGRHAEAVERYRSALRIAGGVGAWWVGIGISQEALSRPQEASVSFQRARGTGNLNAELLAYVDRRLRELQ